MKSTEKATPATILQYLALTNVFLWRNNTGAYKTDHGGGLMAFLYQRN